MTERDSPGPFSFEVRLPDWVGEFAPAGILENQDACMALALDLAERNVALGTGGPFGALVQDNSSGRILALGVNLAPENGNAVLHAETVALMLAAEAGAGAEGWTLYSSCAPCIMCLGAAHWAGVERVVCSALKEDAEALGFDEGAGTGELRAAMRARGVEFRDGVMRERGAQILRAYADGGGEIYGP